MGRPPPQTLGGESPLSLRSWFLVLYSQLLSEWASVRCWTLEEEYTSSAIAFLFIGLSCLSTCLVSVSRFRLGIIRPWFNFKLCFSTSKLLPWLGYEKNKEYPDQNAIPVVSIVWALCPKRINVKYKSASFDGIQIRRTIAARWHNYLAVQHTESKLYFLTLSKYSEIQCRPMCRSVIA